MAPWRDHNGEVIPSSIDGNRLTTTISLDVTGGRADIARRIRQAEAVGWD
jgi:hypothetical protein